jgi:hypothetical protein
MHSSKKKAQIELDLPILVKCEGKNHRILREPWTLGENPRNLVLWHQKARPPAETTATEPDFP